MSLDFQRLERVLAEAAAKGDAEERAAYLAQACGDDAELRAEVERLLAAHEKAGDFLEAPFQPIPDKTNVVSEPDIALERTGAMIGRYKLLEEIGEGGFGVVYMAEQVEPVHRKVALKIIKAGMDTREVVARFEAERQALALMDHPNIAQVFDGGATQTGRPYFVMELVRGVAITDFCDQRKLSTRERLQLFIQVCHAVQHAHQKGIIHRDLKPSNILVTLIDGEAVPKVIDFGVAKALGQKLTDKTLFTSFLRMVGTPAYMSPEQADLSGVDIDTRADIYALGVLLYELLTGVTPFDGETLRRAALDEVRRMIRETEPPKPSTRLQALVAADVRRLKSTNNQRPTVEEIRASSRRLLQIKEKIRLVRGDLDWIAMKCLEKDRRRRYETANSLAGDIERHLDHQPVSASPPGTIYRVGKFVRRHRMGVALGASVGAALVLGLVAALVGFAEARRERDHALMAERQAQTEAARSAQVAQFMKDMLKGVGPSVARGRDTTLLREILDQTAERLGELTNQPAVEADLCETLGIIYRDLSEFANAETMLRKSLTLRQKLYESQGGVHADVASSIQNLAEVFRRRGPIAEAEAGFREALTMRRKLFGNEHIKVAASLRSLASVLRTDSRYAEAEPVYRKVLAIQRKLLGDTHPDVARSLTQLGILLRNMPGRLDEAEACLREALKIQRQRLGEKYPDVAFSLMTLGYTIGKTPKRRAEAVAMLREAVAMQKELLGDHCDTAQSLQFLASLVKDIKEREALCRETLAMRCKILRPDSPGIATSVDRLATVLAKQGKFTEARSLYREEIARIRPHVGNPDTNLWAESVLSFATSLERFANLLRNHGEYAEAEPLAREALAIRRKFPDGNPRGLAKSTRTLGAVLAKQGKTAEAERLYRETLALRKEHPGSDHHGVADAASLLAGLLSSKGRYTEAEAFYREALAIERKRSPGENVRAVTLTVYLGDLFYWQGKLANAETILRDELARVRKPSTNAASAETPQLALVLYHLAQVLRARKGLTEARSLADEALRMYQRHSDWPEKDRDSAFAVYTSILTDQAETFARQGKPEKAADCLQETLDLVSTWPDGARKANFLNKISWNLATSGMPSLGNTGIAVEMAQKAVNLTGRKSAFILDTLAAAYAADGQFTNAVSVQKEAIALLTTDNQKEDYALRLKLYLDGIPYRDAGLLASRANALLKEGKFAEAEPMARECLTLRERLIPTNWLTFNARSMLGGGLLGQKQYTEAEPLLVSGYEGMKQRENQIPAQYRPLRLKEALRRLVQLYEATGQSEKAAKYRQTLAETDKSEASNQAGTP